MWPTTNGMRTLLGADGDLIRRVAGMMVDQVVAEGRNETSQHEYGIGLFDQWDWQQRLWLLRKTVVPMLSEKPPPDAAAVFEATIEAIFAETVDLIALEIDDLRTITDAGSRSARQGKTNRPSWRESVFDVAREELTMFECLGETADVSAWQSLITRLRENLFGPLNYLKAEAFRDGDFKQTASFLHLRGLPNDFLAKIPPLQSLDQTQATIDRLQAVIFKD